VPPLLAWIVTLHLIATMTFMAGQTTILAAAAIVLGQLAFERGRPTLAGFLWAAAFVKPHIALPLLPLAFLLGSWKRGAMLVAWLGVLNLSGCLLAAGTPLFAFDYLDYLRDAHKQVEYNRVGWNYQITSWNRLWYSLSHREIELTTPLTLAGYLTFGAMFALRCALARQRPSPAWLMAVAVTAAVCCCQVLAYELFLLVLVVPLNLELLDANRKKLAWTLAGLLTAHLMPLEIMMEWAKYYHEESTPHLVITSYRSWLVAVQVAVLLCVPPDASAKNR